MRTKRTSFIVLFCIAIVCSSIPRSAKAQQQTIISGSIIDSAAKAIPGVSVTITNEKAQVLAFAISNNKGEYSVPVKSDLPSFILNIRKLNYAVISQTIENRTQQLNFTLQTSYVLLPEVKVKNAAINMRGDTISYMVNKFAESGDRSIGDVLAKMPGIEVQPDGKVLYQGKPINKYYIEGMDLLEGRYGLANKNLPHSSVSSVQVLENHQPIRVLDSLVPVSQAALNIKLKNAVTTTGTAQLGAGLSPLLWFANITPMVFTKKQQLIASYQSNNIGEDVSIQLKALTLESLLEQIETPVQKSNLVNIIETQFPPISSRRFLDNNIHLGTLNHLTKLKKDLDLRMNVSYYNDHQRQQGNNRTEYFLPSGNIFLEEGIRNRLFYHDFKASIALERNAQKGYLLNSSKIHINADDATGNISGTQTVLQKLKVPYSSFSNEFKWITAIKKQLITFYSFINYNRTPQRLTVFPGQFEEALNNNVAYDQMSQEIVQQVWQTHNYAEFTKKLGKFTVTTKAGFLYQQQNTNADIWVNETKAAGAFTNTSEYNKKKLFVRAELIRKTQRSDLIFRLPVSYTAIAVNDNALNKEQKSNAVVFQPSVSWRYKLNDYWEADAMAGFSNDFYLPGQLLYGYILPNYKSLQQKAFPLLQNSSFSFNPGIRFRNPITGLFFNTRYRYVLMNNPFLFNSKVQPNGTQVTEIVKFENRAIRQEGSTKMGYYIAAIKTTLTLGIDLLRQTENQWINNRPTETKNNTVTPNFRINSRFSDHFSVDYILSNSFSKNNTGEAKGQKYFTLSQAGRITIYPKANQQLTLVADHYYNDFLEKKKNNLYIDALYRYTITKKRIDIEINCTNLLNAANYIRPAYSQFYFSQNTAQLRPMQVLFKIRFSF